MPTDYQPGTTLDIRGERWSLAREQRFGACRILTLDGAEPTNAARILRVIEPFDRPRPIARRRLRRRPRRAVLRAALGAIASARTPTGLWSAAASSIEILPYQLEPALAVVSGATRLLLADAVGLGKTIQAGLIVAELSARGWIERTLIVCPCGLRDTWAGELRERFGLIAAVVDQAALAARIATLPPGGNPWSSDSILIVSIDLLKRPEVLSAIDRVPIDLLIADEAHHLTPGTDRGAAVARLAARSPWVVMLSATPHSGDASAFSYLTSIGAHEDSLAVFRRTRHDAGIAGERRTHLLPVHPAATERALFVAVDRYVEAIWHGRGAVDRAVRLVAITIVRRAASSIEALARSLTRRLELLSGAPVREPEQGLLPWDESDAADQIEGDHVLSARGLDDPWAERRALENLLTLARACAGGSKIRRLLRIVGVIHEPVLVFTEFRDTLDAIAAQLHGRPWRVIHGGMPADARRLATASFNEGGAEILLATDAAGEGLNLHHRCRLVIDVELPWNPLRLEQRVGRVDRIGQRRAVHAIRLFYPATIEARVLEHLRVRRQRAEQALDRCTTEQEVAEAMFDNRTIRPATPLPRTAVCAQAGVEARRVQRQRAARTLAASTHSRCWTPARSGPLFALQRHTLLNAAGLPLADRIEAYAVDMSRTPARFNWPRVIDRLSELLPSTTSSDEPWPAYDGLRERIAAIRTMVAHRALVEYQRSLFDGRADAEAAERDRTAARLDAALDRAQRASSTEAVTQRREFIAAWPGPRR